jgi:antirestriction protein ArdC
MTGKAERVDVYQRVTDQIIQAIEAGAETWEMPWHALAPTL